jgi:3-oxoadipate enol-lactonase
MSELDINWIRSTGKKEALLACRATGSGQLFVWGHILMGSMTQEDIIGTLGWSGLKDIARIARYDARGHGRSESSEAPEDYAWPQLAKDMWAVADYYDKKKKNPIILGGASMGAATALHAACQQPKRVKALVLVIPPTAWEERNTTARPYQGFASGVELTRGLPLKMLKWLPPATKASLKGRITRVTARSMGSANPKGISAAMRGAAMSDLPPLEVLEKLQIPTLILAWPNDPVHPLSTALTLARVLPKARLEVSPTADAPDRWPQQVRRFINSLHNPWADAPID